MMRLLVVAVVILNLVSCSLPLKVNVFNHSSSPIVFCSGEDKSNCRAIEIGGRERLIWKTGTFTLTSQDKTFRYSASLPEPFEDYINKDEGSVSLVISSDLNLLILRKGADPISVGTSAQPVGYPLRPNPSIQSGRAGSSEPFVVSQRPAADFRR
jgi:hypothetical protein